MDAVQKIAEHLKRGVFPFVDCDDLFNLKPNCKVRDGPDIVFDAEKMFELYKIANRFIYWERFETIVLASRELTWIFLYLELKKEYHSKEVPLPFERPAPWASGKSTTSHVRKAPSTIPAGKEQQQRLLEHSKSIYDYSRVPQGSGVQMVTGKILNTSDDRGETHLPYLAKS